MTTMATVSRVSLDWMADALCAGMGVGMAVDPFYPGRGAPGRTTAARAFAVCFQCPVQGACLDYALSSCDDFGIWGGTSESGRRRMRALPFVQLELLWPPPRSPHAGRSRRLGRLRLVFSRFRAPMPGQLVLGLAWELDGLLADERFGVWGTASRSTIQARAS